MLKKIVWVLLTISLLEGESLSSLLTQRGGSYNAIFLNPAYLKLKRNDSEIKVDFMNASLGLSNESLSFLKALNRATESSNKNREISELLKKNIGETLSFSAHNFSSISKLQENLSWSLGLVDTLDGYFITHSGFGSKGAMESFIEKYKALIATVVLTQENLNYGLNIKVMEKSQGFYNYSITEMIKNSSFSDYFKNRNSQEERALGLDAGLVYNIPNYIFNPKLSFSVLDIGDSSFQEMGRFPSTSNIGLSLSPYEDTFIKFDYIDLFKHQPNQHFAEAFRASISQDFFDKSVNLSSGIIHNALSFGVEYHASLFTIGANSYKTKNYTQEKERKYELSLIFSW